jgi:transposase InsO family protein
MWSDRGGEYLSNLFDEYCKDCGIIHETTAPYSLESNGVAKRKNRTVCDLANALLQSSGMPDIWWGEAVLTVCYVLNRVPPRNREATPYEGFKGRKPDLSHL